MNVTVCIFHIYRPAFVKFLKYNFHVTMASLHNGGWLTVRCAEGAPWRRGETSVHVFRECEAVATLGHTCPGSFFLGPWRCRRSRSGGDLGLYARDRAPITWILLILHHNSVWIRNQLDVTFVLSFISVLQVAQHVSGNHLPMFRRWRLHNVIATCWYCAVAAGRLSEPVSRECVLWGVRCT